MYKTQEQQQREELELEARQQEILDFEATDEDWQAEERRLLFQEDLER